MMARARREATISHSAQLAAERLDRDRDAEFLEDPLAEIDQPPAHDAVDRRDWAFIDCLGERCAMRVVQPRGLARRFPVDEAVGTMGNLTTQSRTICTVTLPTLAASARLAPS